MNIDLNCDLGESSGSDAAIMPYITSANIACGFHAGGPAVMQATVRLAKRHGVHIGAHPGWPDLQGFGRREMSFSGEEVEALVLYQMGALAAIARAEGVKLRHVKPHGALYNQAAVNEALAESIARAVKRFSRDLILIGLAGSSLVECAREIGLSAASEAFPDRAYNPDGTLMPRNLPGAVLHDPAAIAANAVRLAREGVRFGEKVIFPDTLCLHGDNETAAENARLAQEALAAAGIKAQGL